MRALFSAALAVGFCMLQATAFGQVSTSGYTLSFQEEFNSTTLDNTKWNHLLPWKGVSNAGNGELQAYKAVNATVRSGYLNIVVKKENYQGYKYTSDMLNTYDKFSQQYGLFEIEYQLPSNIGNGKGYWPAFWLLSGGNGSYPWPPEIDVMEGSGAHPTQIAQTVHYSSNGVTRNSNTLATAPYDTSKKSVRVTLDWQPTYLKWYVNGVLTKTVTDPAMIPQAPMYLLVNVAVGNKYWAWVGNPDSGTKFPGTLKVNYIRVWQKN